MTMRRILTILLAFALLTTFAVAPVSAWSWDSENEGSSGDTQMAEAKHTEINHGKLVKSTPPPMLTRSLERENLKHRLEFLNNENQLFYVYLLGNDGGVIMYCTAKGKVSSVNSKLTTGEQIIKSPFGYGGNGGGNMGIPLESPSLDGSYGTNGDGIFFFTTNDVYVEWNGKYIVSSEPLTLSIPASIVM